jgi:hypothetical protein
MKAVSGVFRLRSDAEHVVGELHSLGMRDDQIALLTPESSHAESQSVPTVGAEQPGMGKAIGALLGGVTGMGGAALATAVIPGVGPVMAIGLLGVAVLGAAGAGVGAVVGGKVENSMTRGVPHDEMFVYEDALRQGRSVVICFADDEAQASLVRELLGTEGAEAVDAAREQWWIGLRGAENEHYATLGRSFGNDEKFYRHGFEAALDTQTRCKTSDEVIGEMTVKIEELESQHSGVEVAEPFKRGFERGRDYYQELCSKQKAA